MDTSKSHLELTSEERSQVWEKVKTAVENYSSSVSEMEIFPKATPEKIRSLISEINFDQPVSATQAITWVESGLTKYQLHYSSPGYLGHFVPRPTLLSVVADALSNGFDSQLTTWRSAPFAIELEQHLLRELAKKIHFSNQAAGLFTSGGSEANHLSVLAALAHRLPQFVDEGLCGQKSLPRIYVSREAHHCLQKAAVAVGLGRRSICEIEVDENMKMDPVRLRENIQKDLQAGYFPLMVVGTIGTTNTGAIDPLTNLADIAKEFNLWFHVDGAYGGPCGILPEFQKFYEGISAADSVTLDPHKLFSISMGCGVFLTRHHDVLKKCFSIQAPFLAKSEYPDVVEPFVSSMIWSRRFIGLKLHLTLAVSGWSGMQATLEHHLKMSDVFKKKIIDSGWALVAQSPLPVICFVSNSPIVKDPAAFHTALTKEVNSSGKVWIGSTHIGAGQPVLRVTICNRLTDEKIIENVVDRINEARRKLLG